MDTKNGVIAIISAATLGALLIISLVGIIILAAAHDGELATNALETFKQIIVVIAPSVVLLAGVHQVTNTITASKQISASASVATAQVANGSPVTVSPSPVPTVAPVAPVAPVIVAATPGNIGAASDLAGQAASDPSASIGGAGI